MNKWHMDGNPWGTARKPKARENAAPPSGPDKTASWPGLPGKKQSKSRDRSGTPKVKTSMKQII